MENRSVPTGIEKTNKEVNTLENLDLIFSENLDEVNSDRFIDYVPHILCHAGTCSFQLAGKSFVVKEGDFVIFPYGKLASDFIPSSDFKVTVLYVSNRFVRKNAPHNNYDVVGTLSMLQNPIMVLNDSEKIICDGHLQNIKARLLDTSHAFYEDLMGCLVMAFFLDLFQTERFLIMRLNYLSPPNIFQKCVKK